MNRTQVKGHRTATLQSALGLSLASCLGLVCLGPASVSAAPEHQRDGVYVDTELSARHDDAVRMRATLDVDASPNDVFDAIMDFESRAADSSMLDEVSVYKQPGRGEQTERRARWHVSLMGYQVQFHTVYTADRDLGLIRTTLDSSKHNDVRRADGLFELEALGNGRTRIHYEVEAEPGQPVPRFVHRKLVRRNMVSELLNLERRARA